MVTGFVLWGYPSSPNPEYASITPWGQLLGAIIMFGLLGFLPCFIVAGVLKRAGLLRIPFEVEIAGLDRQAQVEESQQSEEVLEAERESVGKAG